MASQFKEEPETQTRQRDAPGAKNCVNYESLSGENEGARNHPVGWKTQPASAVLNSDHERERAGHITPTASILHLRI